MNDVPIDQHLENERQFFLDHQEYREVVDKCGTDVLGQKLSKILADHIQAKLPALKIRVLSRIQELKGELRLLGEPIQDNFEAASGLLTNILNEYKTNLGAAIDGQGTPEQSQVFGGSVIKQILRDDFKRSLYRQAPTPETLTDEEISWELSNASGLNGTLFIPQQAFEHLTQKFLRKLIVPCMERLQAVYTKMDQLVSLVDIQSQSRFPAILPSANNIAQQITSRLRDEAEHHIKFYLDCQVSSLSLEHPRFIGGARAVTSANVSLNFRENSDRPSPALVAGSEDLRRQRDINVTRILVKSYYDLTMDSVLDLIPKIIDTKLIQETKDKILPELMSALNRPEMFEQLLAEAPNIAEQRVQVQQELEQLQAISVDLR